MSNKYTNDQLEAMYLDWFNNYISTKAFMQRYSLSVVECENVLDEGRKLNHARNDQNT